MAITKQLKTLVDQMPDPDDRRMYTKNIDKEKIESAVAKIFAGGRDNVQGLIDMLGKPGSPENVKPHYALHCVLNHALIVEDENARREFALTLAKNLDGDLSTYNKAYLCQELQWMGREEVVESLGQLLLDEALVEPAAMALVAIKRGAPAALTAALPQADGKCRLNIIDALAALDDVDSADALKAALKDDDEEVRIAARAGLAKIPDAAAATAVLHSAEDTHGWERIQSAKSALVAAETLAGAGKSKEAENVYDQVKQTFDDENEAYLHEAVKRGKAAIAGYTAAGCNARV
ncbi:MAG: HEAT repeat domain-containing protein [Planctomycetota bacterium]